MTSPDALQLTHHARLRMEGRRIPEAGVSAVLEHGRAIWARGALIHAVGRREVARAARHGVDLRPWEGVQVVCAPDGHVVTVYRNHDFRPLRRAS